MDGLLIIAVVLLVVVGVYLLLDRLLRNDERRRAGEVRRQAVKEVVPVRLRAYERLALFLERTKPDTLLPEVVQPGMTCLQLHAKLLETIRREYGHNVSQQLYVGDEKCSLLRPQKELKHFDKILLQPGEEKTVTFTITPDDLKFYDDRVGRWVAEPGKFKLYVGASSTDIRGTATFELL